LAPQLKRHPLGGHTELRDAFTQSYVVTVNDYDDVHRHVASIGRRPGLTICSVDGYRLSGKTFLVKRLAEDLSLSRFSTDEYREPDREGRSYVDQLSLEDLAADVEAAGKNGPVLVEGICIGWTLLRLKFAAEIRVYCKRMTQTGLWADDLQNYVANGMPQPHLSPFDREVVVYHLQTSPDDNATLVYSWDGDALAA
jgi:hypothetical protein